MSTVGDGDPVGEPRPATAPGRRRPAPVAIWWETSRAALALCLVLLVIVPAALTYLHLRAYTPLSVIDEQAHLDYVIKGPALLPVVAGDQMSPEVLRALSCRGIENGFSHPPCATPVLDPAAYELEGYNSAYIHPPVYYVVTAVGADLILATGVTDDVVNAARAVGAFWLSTGLLLAWVAGRLFGCRRVPLLAALLVLGSTPGVVYEAATVTNGAASIVAGALVMVALAVVDRRLTPASSLLLALAAALAVAIRMQNIVVLIAAALFVVLRAWDRWRADPPGAVTVVAMAKDRSMLSLALLLVPSVIVAVVWNLTWPRVASIRPVDLPFARFTFDPVLTGVDAVGKFLTIDSFVPAVIFRLPNLVLAQLATVVFLGAMVVTLVAPVALRRVTGRDGLLTLGPADVVDSVRDPGPLLALGRSTLAAAILAGPFLLVLLYFVVGDVFHMQERYGATLLPAMVIVAAGVWDGRWPARALALAALAFIATETYVLSVA